MRKNIQKDIRYHVRCKRGEWGVRAMYNFSDVSCFPPARGIFIWIDFVVDGELGLPFVWEMSAYTVLSRLAGSTFFCSNLQWWWSERSNLVLKFLLSEGARESTEMEFFDNICMNCVNMRTRTWKIGGSKSLIEWSKIADGKAICELEWEFWIPGEKLHAFEKDLKVKGQIWCVDFFVVMIIVIWRRFFCLEIVKVDVRHEDIWVCIKKWRLPVSIKWSYCKRRFQERSGCQWHLRDISMHRLHGQWSRTMSRHVGQGGRSCNDTWQS